MPKNNQILTNPGKLLIKNADEFTGKNPLVVNYQPDNFGKWISEHFEDDPVTFLSFDYSNLLFLQKDFEKNNITKNRTLFTAFYQNSTDKHDLVIIYLPKSRALIDYIFSMIADVSAKDSKIFIVGENKSSIRSCIDSINKYFGDIVYQKPGKHSVLYKIIKNTEQINDNTSDIWVENFEADIFDKKFSIKHLPGVFSHGKLDKGTQFLLENLPNNLSGEILDLGCGSGIISLALKQNFSGTDIHSVDVNAFAIKSSKLTLLANGFSANKVYVSDVFSDVTCKFDYIISNPPFHTGINTNYSVVENIFENASKHLKKDGKLLIVANRFLKYPYLIKKFIGNCEIIAENNSYRVYQASNI